MKFSIVTLSFNQGAYLREAIESVLNQDHTEVEYIVVDPGSTDGSREIIQSYSDRISHIIFEPDHGAAEGLNKGFSFASGEILGFLNADDLLMPGSLQRVGDFFRQCPKCEMAMGDGYIVDGRLRRLRHVKARDFTVRRYLYSGTQFLQQSTFFRRETFLRSPRFNTENRTCWDGELFVNLVNQGAEVGYIDADLAAFRIHEASITGMGANQKAFRKDCRRVFKELRGRDWRLSDELLRFLYRSEGLLLRIGSQFQTSDSRRVE